MRRGRSFPKLLVTALAVMAQLVLLVAPATCSCAQVPRRATKGSEAAHACCCKPGDAPMACHSQGRPAQPRPARCASSHSHELATLTDAPSVPQAPMPVATALPALATTLASACLDAPEPNDTGPPIAARPSIALVLTRTSVLLI